MQLTARLRRIVRGSPTLTRWVRRVGRGRLVWAMAVGLIVLALAVGTVIALAAGSLSWAIAPVGVTALLVLVAVAIVWSTLRRIELDQRRILAAVERERLDAAERHRELLSAVVESTTTPSQPA